MADTTIHNDQRRPSRWASMPEGARDVLGGFAWAVLVFALLAVFVVEGVAVGLIWTVLTLLIVIAVKVTAIARNTARR